MTREELYRIFGGWLSLPTPEALDIVLAVVLANRCSTDPLWMFLVAPPSSAKTELLRALGDVSDTYPLSNLTASTFASGFQNPSKTSLLPKITGKLLVLKDFTTVLELPRETRSQIYAQLREIYDGSYTKEWGTGQSLVWEGKIGVLAGVTPEIDRQYAIRSSLGDRFVMYRLNAPDAETAGTKGLAQQGHERDGRALLRRAVSSYLTGIPTSLPVASNGHTAQLTRLAILTAAGRTGIFYDQRGVEIDYTPPPEGPARLAKQFHLLLRCLALARGHSEPLEEDLLTIAKVAVDTIPAQRMKYLRVLLAQPDLVTTTRVAELADTPTDTCRRYLSELCALGFLLRQSNGPGKPDAWQLSNQWRDKFTDLGGVGVSGNTPHDDVPF